MTERWSRGPVDMTSLWLPYRVPDLAAAREFYTVNLGLAVTDAWAGPHERGVVLRAADSARIELVEPGPPGPAPLAFELPDRAAVDAAHAAWRPRPAPPHTYPRGHYGFEAPGPAGATIMVWSEKR